MVQFREDSADISCAEQTFCWLPFIRNRIAKLKNVYNIESGRIVKRQKSRSPTNFRQEKYKSNGASVAAEIASIANGGEVAYRRHHRYSLQHQLHNNLSHGKRGAERATSPEFINQLEENSRKIENIFSKCKNSSASHEDDVMQAVRAFLDNDDPFASLPRVPPSKYFASSSVPSLSRYSTKAEDYEHIRNALQLMFPGTRFSDEKDAKTSTHAAETRLQGLVDDILKLKGEKHSNLSVSKDEVDDKSKCKAGYKKNALYRNKRDEIRYNRAKIGMNRLGDSDPNVTHVGA